MQPVGQAGIGIVRFVLMDLAFRSRDITAVAIAVNHTTMGKGSVSKFFHRRLFDISHHPHFQKAGI